MEKDSGTSGFVVFVLSRKVGFQFLFWMTREHDNKNF